MHARGTRSNAWDGAGWAADRFSGAGGSAYFASA
ncbi:hypothetical protein FHR80_002282 [Cellulomonas cellasea]|uniref:Uncharacterized protein n=1 Tax=Cellulomonas cellasea TaxID=43670 RepID=A0A7W4UFV1_9CELL|nr:hypothetical protein [Cellulomonas cellasea]